MDKEINKLIWTLFVPHSLQDKRNIFFHFIRKKTISTQHVLRHINFQFLWPGWHHPRPYDNLCPDPSDWGKTPSSYFTRTASESNIWKVAVSIMKMKTKLFFWSALSSNLFVFPFHFIDRKSRPFFAQSAGDQNAWSKCFWRSEWWEKLRDPGDTLKKRLKKMKTRRGGGEDEGVINIELSCTEIFSAFALAATLWLMVSSLKNAVFKIKAKPCNAELFIFRWFCESILVKWHHINLYIINISHSLNISVTHRSCGSFICLICRNQDY